MRRTITTVGHSNHEPDEFVGLLKKVGIQHVVDIRSQPYSRFAPQFNFGALRSLLADHGIEYTHDKDLGGWPDSEDMYDAAGHVLYGRLAESRDFEQAVERLETAVKTPHVLAIMCGEEDPTECHRRLLVGKVLGDRGWQVRHLRGGGHLMSEEELTDVSGGVEPGLFEGGEFSAWRSIRSVSPRNPPNSSSEH